VNYKVERINPDGTPYIRDGLNRHTVWVKHVTAETVDEAGRKAGLHWANTTFIKVGFQWEPSSFSQLDFPIFIKVTWEDHEKKFMLDRKATVNYPIVEIA